MSREIRRVPPDWEHPVNEQCDHIGRDPHRGRPCYKALYDEDYETAARKWKADYAAFEAMTDAERADKYGELTHYYWEYAAPPNEDAYRSRQWTPDEATAYQVYETVSEGTPVSPVFQTEDDLRSWLIGQGHTERAVEAFMRDKWVPSAMIVGGTWYSGIESAGLPPTPAASQP